MLRERRLRSDSPRRHQSPQALRRAARAQGCLVRDQRPRAHRPHRSQRRRQDHVDQRARRRDQAQQRHRLSQRQAHRPVAALRCGAHGPGPHLPGHPVVPPPERSREPVRPGPCDAPAGQQGRRPRQGDGSAPVPHHGASAQRVRPGALRRAAETPGARTAADARPGHRDSGRALRRRASAADGDHLRLHPAGERGGQGDHHHLAPDGLDLQSESTTAGAEFWRPDCRRTAGRGQARPRRHRSLSGTTTTDEDESHDSEPGAMQ